MQDLLLDNYLWLKALHIISIICWMAGLLYLPRLFVYHVDAKKGSKQSEDFKIMEWRLFKFIMNPAMIAAWVFGGAMLYANSGLLSAGWMHAKLTMVILMTGFHHVLLKWLKVFKNDENKRSAKYYKIANEIPTVLMLAIVILAVVKPF
jgi:putative membrane protein